MVGGRRQDIADLHIKAMVSPEAAGQRLVVGGDFLWIEDMATILRDDLGERARKVPRRKLPDVVVRVGALFNGDMRTMVPRLEKHYDVSSQRAERLGGWKARPAAESTLAAAHGLIADGLI